MKYFQILLVLSKILPVVYELVKSLESIGGAPGTGKDKLELVLQAVRSAVEQAGDTGVKFSDIEPAIRAAVEGFLAVLRKV